MSFELPKLGYAYDALEPTIDAQTMEIHYTKHHQAYVDNLNKAIAGTDLEGKTIEEVIKEGSDKPAVRNNGGGHFNHTLFWEILTPGGSKEPVGKVKEAIENYGGLEKFKTDFAEAAKTRFGSGWAWLIKNADGSVSVGSTANQDSPITPGAGVAGTPVLGIDVWEHAYYLKYQNKRPDYVTAFFDVINWDKVEENYNK
ncbi:superoxide dismutase [Elizabethkingia anophelis]|jgi:Fe-Mn family superoxide dismutase|uniref:Superoxide dismutase n=6 Tax=Elizabethkingia TaxID=308865 RepID=A0AAJ3NE81_9FLAO|nr:MULTISPECIES: superoxide dismutase [Elizabethkingia]MDR2230481.1 superoxide dismutase [Flavobacteriaceae bacterium]AIL47603.1 Manganese superoxide dismutase [Elizabethkingia anophelis NUHP1]AJW64323.1 Superoxide dismutase Mn/Fe [Elizabethkingia miricola]AKH96057.1 superoxide dismutase [Elizabethkingia anophelis FMS-007]AMR42048.1 superoxide dismutase [Elizabethkingia anophelis]